MSEQKQPKPEMPLVWIHQRTQGSWTDDECIEFAKIFRNRQRDADLAVLDAEKRKWAKQEADWLQKLGDIICNETCGSTLKGCGAGCNMSDQIEPRIADLRKQAGE